MNAPSAAAELRALDRDQIHDELRQRRETFHTILASSTAGELRRPSNGTRWNNQELLFHMLFGYMVVVVLLRMVKVLGLLPRTVSKAFALLLNASTRPFNAINYWGSRLAAVYYNDRRMGAKFDRVAASLANALDRTRDASLRRGMYYPKRWTQRSPTDRERSALGANLRRRLRCTRAQNDGGPHRAARAITGDLCGGGCMGRG